MSFEVSSIWESVVYRNWSTIIKAEPNRFKIKIFFINLIWGEELLLILERNRKNLVLSLIPSGLNLIKPGPSRYRNSEILPDYIWPSPVFQKIFRSDNLRNNEKDTRGNYD